MYTGKSKGRIAALVFALIVLFAACSARRSDVCSAAQCGSFGIMLDYRGNGFFLSDKDFAVGSADHMLQGRLKRRGEGYAEKAQLALIAKGQGHTPYEIINYILPLFDRKLDIFADRIEKEPIPSEIYFEPRDARFTLTREAAGFKIDREDLYRRLLDAFTGSPNVRLTVKTFPVHSAVTAEYWKKATFLKSAFSTGFSASSPDRKHNIALAASFWDGLRIEPGTEASFNKVVGPRTAARGFREAAVIVNKQLERGIGGGVCQVSTTVYNAALKAGMEITAAVNHSLAVSYVMPSFDAAVSSATDMRFKNNTAYPVFVRAYCRDNRLHVQFYGERNAYTIERRSEKIKVIRYEKDETITDYKGEYLDKVRYKGETARIREAKDGLVSKGYLRYYRDGRFVKEVLIRTDSYMPQNGLTVEGSLPPPPPAPSPFPAPVPPPERLMPSFAFP